MHASTCEGERGEQFRREPGQWLHGVILGNSGKDRTSIEKQPPVHKTGAVSGLGVNCMETSRDSVIATANAGSTLPQRIGSEKS